MKTEGSREDDPAACDQKLDVSEFPFAADLPGDDETPLRALVPERDVNDLFPLAIADLADHAKEYGRKRYAQNTILARRKDWSSFRDFCTNYGLRPLPASPQTVALYLIHLADVAEKKTSTIGRHLATISVAHQRHGVAPTYNPARHPAVREVWGGIRREKGVATTRKQPVLLEILQVMVRALPDSLTGTRDRALLLLGFAGAMRRSELVALTVRDIETGPEGLKVRIARSKTDQEAKGRQIGIPFGQALETCPVRALHAWLKASGITEGPVPVFRKVTKDGTIWEKALSAGTVAVIVKRTLARAGVDPAQFAGHSLRAGLATQAARGGASERSIQRQTGHRDLTVLREYIREGNLFLENAVHKTGL